MELTVKKSTLPNAGKGLFTKDPIKKGEKVIEYLGEIIDWKEYERRVAKDEDGYLFFINKKHCIDAFNTPEHIARFANDAEGLSKIKGLKNNAEYAIEKKTNRCFIVAKRDIAKGEEIFVSYTKEYWDCIRYNIKLKADQAKEAATEKAKAAKKAAKKKK
ncbi:MAG: SET domain-containing protein [Bacteroidota bacterium]|nr:SET domain-containing protein [Bacteroidota bacterium]